MVIIMMMMMMMMRMMMMMMFQCLNFECIRSLTFQQFFFIILGKLMDT